MTLLVGQLLSSPLVSLPPVPGSCSEMTSSFFGVTQLGPQEVFQSNIADALDMTFFDDAEVEQAFRKFDKDGSDAVDAGDLRAVLEDLYHGEAPEREVTFYARRFGSAAGTRVAWGEFLAATRDLRSEAAVRERSDAQYRSSAELQTTLRRHARPSRGPVDRFRRPVTTSQEVGWHRDGARIPTERRPKQSCEETKFAAYMVLQGEY